MESESESIILIILYVILGIITVEELVAAIHSLNEHPTKEEVQDMMSQVDTHGDGTNIGFEDFLNIMATKMKVNLLIYLFILVSRMNIIKLCVKRL